MRLRDLARKHLHRVRATMKAGEAGQNGIASNELSGGVDDDETSPFLPCTDYEVERWNKEWLAYLAREYPEQLSPHHDRAEQPELPDDPLELLSLKIGDSPPLSVYCDADRIRGKRLMEIGCGCGNMGKYLGRYCQSYLGTDYSTLALMAARLVSPENCHYIHLSDHDGLRKHFGAVDTVIGRFFWIHQNMVLAKRLLRFIEPFLADGGRIYADFRWVDPEGNAKGVILSPHDALSERYPSATFAYSPEHIEELIAGTPFYVEREVIHEKMERRYVVFGKRE